MEGDAVVAESPPAIPCQSRVKDTLSDVSRRTGLTTQARWILASREELNGGAIAWREICGSECIARLLLRKGFRSVEEVQNFLRPRLNSLSDPFLLPQMETAVSRVLRGLDRHQRIVLFGDYDVDGGTSLALLDEILRAYGGAPELFLPFLAAERSSFSPTSID